jgi:TonB family protein
MLDIYILLLLLHSKKIFYYMSWVSNNKSISGSTRINLIFLVLVTCIVVISSNPLSSYAQNKTSAAPYGGNRQLKGFIKEEMVYPPAALDRNIEGEVVISLHIGENGEVLNMEVLSSPDSLLDREAVRILDKILWHPANYMGINIEDNQLVSIKFKIKRYQKTCRERGYNEIIYPRLPVDESNQVFSHTEVDSIPRLLFEDKTMTLSKFINENIEYPEEALVNNLSGTEEIEFLVEPSGRVSNIRSIVHMGAGCCEEAIRLIKMLNWYPGIKEDQAVRTKMSISITFNLNQNTGIQYVPTHLNSSMQ